MIPCPKQFFRKRGRPKTNLINYIFEYSNLPLQKFVVIAKDRYKW